MKEKRLRDFEKRLKNGDPCEGEVDPIEALVLSEGALHWSELPAKLGNIFIGNTILRRGLNENQTQ